MRHAIVLALLLSPLMSAHASGEACVIPKLVRGVPVEVAVEDVSKGLCGVALIGDRFVRIDEVADRKITRPIHCSANDECRRRTDYYLSPSDNQPYIIIFSGPRGTG